MNDDWISPDCRLVDHDTHGVEAQFLLDDRLLIAHRFATKELALGWAEDRRHARTHQGWMDEVEDTRMDSA